MDEQVTNAALASLIVISLIVALSGFLISIRPTITGFATAAVNDTNTTTANVTLVSSVAISVTGRWDFGSGFVTEGTGKAALESGAVGYTFYNWSNTTPATGQPKLSNVGNTNVTVSARANQTPHQWLCAGELHNNTQEINTTGSGSTGDGSLCIVAYTNLSIYGAYADVHNTSNGVDICASRSLGVQESVNVDLRIRIDEACEATDATVFTTISFFADTI